MTDIVERLRAARESSDEWQLIEEAADKIVKLHAELQYARDGLTKGRTRMREDIARLRAELAAAQPAQDDAYYCGRRDEEKDWASRFDNLSAMLKQSDERYMALLKNVADGMALRPPAPIIMQAPAQPAQEPVAWLCEFFAEDGSTRTQIVQQDPAGLRWNDAGEPADQMRAYGEACAAAEREACANIVEYHDQGGSYNIRTGLAAAIRARTMTAQPPATESEAQTPTR